MPIPQETVVVMKANQKTTLFLSAKFNDGKCAPVGSKPIWTTTNSNLVDLKPSEDGQTCEVRGKMQVGKCKVVVEAIGASGTIASTTTLDIKSPYADVLETTAGTPDNI